MICEEELLPLIFERLDAGFKVRYLQFRGVSMLPMLRQGKDSVELSPLPEKLKKYDLPVYRRKNGQLVMHRVVKVKDDYYLCLGDNTEVYETIYPNQMIGLVTAFKRKDKRIEISALSYRLYCHLWRPTRPLRVIYKKTKHLIRRCFR
jgi:hypothetical protein